MADYRNWQHLCAYRGRGKPYTVYTGLGPGNTAIVLYGAPDLDVDQLQQKFTEYGGTFGVSLQWMMQEKGQILLSKRENPFMEETVILEAMGAGAEDVLFDDGDLMEIRVRSFKLQEIADILELEDVVVLHAEKVFMPRQNVPVEDSETIEKLVAFLEEVLRWDGIWNITSDFWILDEKLENGLNG